MRRRVIASEVGSSPVSRPSEAPFRRLRDLLRLLDRPAEAEHM